MSSAEKQRDGTSLTDINAATILCMLGIALMMLKMGGYLTWGWLWVTLPLWGTMLAAAVYIVGMLAWLVTPDAPTRQVQRLDRLREQRERNRRLTRALLVLLPDDDLDKIELVAECSMHAHYHHHDPLPRRLQRGLDRIAEAFAPQIAGFEVTHGIE